MRQKLLFTILVSALLAACSTVKQFEYADMQAVAEASQGARSWIPEFIPDSATNIIEIHDLDTKQLCLQADVPEADFHGVIASSMLQGFEPYQGFVPDPPDFTPEGQCPFNLEELPMQSLYGFHIPLSENAYMLLDPENHRLYFWVVNQ